MATDLTWPADRMSKFIDVSPRRLAQLVQEGVIERAERGRYNPFVVTVAYIRWLRDQRSAPPDTAGDQSAAAAKIDRARRTKAEADIAEMSAAEKRKETWSRDHVRLLLADRTVATRRAIEDFDGIDGAQKTKLLTRLSKITLPDESED